MALGNVLTLMDCNFPELVEQSDVLVLVDFWSASCAPREANTQIVEELAGEYAGRIRVGKMDIDLNSVTSVRYAVNAFPTLAIFRREALVKRLVGPQQKANVQAAIDEVLG